MGAYVADLGSVIDMEAIAGSGLRLGVDPLGGAAVDYWGAIGERYGLDLTVTNDAVDPQFGFMTLDWDGKIRMDPSSPFAMAGLVGLRDRFDLALGNDADADRHGIVVPGAGLMNPNHVIAAAISYLFGGGRDWGADVAVGKTLVSSSMIDRVVADLGRRLLEVPVGFKWFVDGLVDGSVGFGGEESAGASFLRRDGTVWTTDKDGLIACLLAAELTARLGQEPGGGLRRAHRAVRVARLPADRRPGDAGAQGRPRQAVPGGRHGDDARRRPDRREAHPRPRQRRADRRPQGGHRPGLVRGAPVGDGERHEALRGVVPRRGPPRPDPGRGDGDPRRGGVAGGTLARSATSPSRARSEGVMAASDRAGTAGVEAYRALVLHDRQLVVDLIELTLNHGLFVVRAARSLQEAETIVGHWQPHLAVVDMDHDDSTALLRLARCVERAHAERDAGPRPHAARRPEDEAPCVRSRGGRHPDDAVLARGAPRPVDRHHAPGARESTGRSCPRSRLGEMEIDILNREVRAGTSVVHLSGHRAEPAVPAGEPRRARRDAGRDPRRHLGHGLRRREQHRRPSRAEPAGQAPERLPPPAVHRDGSRSAAIASSRRSRTWAGAPGARRPGRPGSLTERHRDERGRIAVTRRRMTGRHDVAARAPMVGPASRTSADPVSRRATRGAGRDDARSAARRWPDGPALRL